MSRAPLAPCPACARHVRSSESQCPFCAGALTPNPDAAYHEPVERLSRAALASFVATAALSAACGPSVHQVPTPQPTAVTVLVVQQPAPNNPPPLPEPSIIVVRPANPPPPVPPPPTPPSGPTDPVVIVTPPQPPRPARPNPVRPAPVPPDPGMAVPAYGVSPYFPNPTAPPGGPVARYGAPPAPDDGPF